MVISLWKYSPIGTRVFLPIFLLPTGFFRYLFYPWSHSHITLLHLDKSVSPSYAAAQLRFAVKSLNFGDFIFHIFLSFKHDRFQQANTIHFPSFQRPVLRVPSQLPRARQHGRPSSRRRGRRGRGCGAQGVGEPRSDRCRMVEQEAPDVVSD